MKTDLFFNRLGFNPDLTVDLTVGVSNQTLIITGLVHDLTVYLPVSVKSNLGVKFPRNEIKKSAPRN